MSCAAGIVTESDQAAFESNHADSKADVTLATLVPHMKMGQLCLKGHKRMNIRPLVCAPSVRESVRTFFRGRWKQTQRSQQIDQGDPTCESQSSVFRADKSCADAGTSPSPTSHVQDTTSCDRSCRPTPHDAGELMKPWQTNSLRNIQARRVEERVHGTGDERQ